jgi:hypothetical protein
VEKGQEIRSKSGIFGSVSFPYAGWIPGQFLVMTGGPRWSGNNKRKEKGRVARLLWGAVLLGRQRLILAARGARGAIPLAGWAEIGPVWSGGRNFFLLKFCFLFPILVLGLQNSQIKYGKICKNSYSSIKHLGNYFSV